MFHSRLGRKIRNAASAAEPDPFIDEDAALLREQQAADDSDPEQRYGVLLLQAQSRDHAEP